MFAYFYGTYQGLTDEILILDVSGIGYEIHIPTNIYDELPQIGEHLKLYTYTQLREDAITLFGFMETDSLNLFKKLITVSGIGPKGALSLLSCMTKENLILAIIEQDAKKLSKAPGIGLRTAERIIVDLKDKVNADSLLNSMLSVQIDQTVSKDLSEVQKDGIETLVALGYSSSSAREAVLKVALSESPTLDDLLHQALKYII